VTVDTPHWNRWLKNQSQHHVKTQVVSDDNFPIVGDVDLRWAGGVVLVGDFQRRAHQNGGVLSSRAQLLK